MMGVEMMLQCTLELVLLLQLLEEELYGKYVTANATETQ